MISEDVLRAAIGPGRVSGAKFSEPRQRRVSLGVTVAASALSQEGSTPHELPSVRGPSDVHSTAHAGMPSLPSANLARAPLHTQSSLMHVMKNAEQEEVQLTNKQVREQLLQRLAEPRSLVAAASMSSDLGRRQRRARMARASAKSGQTLLSQVPANIKNGRRTKAGVQRVLGTGSEGRGGPTGGGPAFLQRRDERTAGQARTLAQSRRRQETDEVPTVEQLARHILSQISQSSANAQSPPRAGRDAPPRAHVVPGGSTSSGAAPALPGLGSAAAMQSISNALQDAAEEVQQAGSATAGDHDLDSTGVLTALLHKLAADPLVPLSRPDMMLTAEELAASQVGQYIAQYITRSSGVGTTGQTAKRRSGARRRAEQLGDAEGDGGSDSTFNSASTGSDSSGEEWEVQETHTEGGGVTRRLVPASSAGAIERRRRRTARAERKRSLMRTADSVRSTEPIWQDGWGDAPGASPVDRAIARMSHSDAHSTPGPAVSHAKQQPPDNSPNSRRATRKAALAMAPAVLSPLAVAHTLAFSSLLAPSADHSRSPSAMSSSSVRSAVRRRRNDDGDGVGEALVQVNAVADMAAVEQMLATRSPRSGRLVGTAAHGSRNASGRGRGLINSGFVALAAAEAAAAAAARRGETEPAPLLQTDIAPHPPAGAGQGAQKAASRIHSAGGGRLSTEALYHASARAAQSLAHERRAAQLKAEGGAVTVPIRALRRLAHEARQPKPVVDAALQQLSETAVVFRDAEENASAEAARQDRVRRLASLRRAQQGRDSLAQPRAEFGGRPQSQDHTEDNMRSSLPAAGHTSLSAPKSSSLQRALDSARNSANTAAEEKARRTLPPGIREIASMADAARSVQFSVVAAAAQAKQRQQTRRRGEQLHESMSQDRSHDQKPWRQRRRSHRRKNGRKSPRQGTISRASAASSAGASVGEGGEGGGEDPAAVRVPVPPLSVSLIGAQSAMHNSTDAAVHAHLQSAVQRMAAFRRLAEDAHARHETAVEFTSMVGAGAATAMVPLRSYVADMSDKWGRVASSTARVHVARERLATAAGQYSKATASHSARSDGTGNRTGIASKGHTMQWMSKSQPREARRPSVPQSLQSLRRAVESLSAHHHDLAAKDFNQSRAGTGADGTRRKFWQRHGGVRQVALQHLSEADTARRQRMLDHLNNLEAQGIPLPVDSSVGQRA